MLSLKTTMVSLALFCYLILISDQPVSALVLNQCDAAKQLASAGVPRTFISNFVCLMQSESNFNTSKKTGPGHKASFSYGIFQISSDEWCNAWRPGGYCNRTCSDFLNGDIEDDIACAQTIWKMRGFKHWKSWEKNCKNKKLPDVSQCFESKNFEEKNTVDKSKEEILRNLRFPEWDPYGANLQVFRLDFSQFAGLTNSFM